MVCDGLKSLKYLQIGLMLPQKLKGGISCYGGRGVEESAYSRVLIYPSSLAQPKTNSKNFLVGRIAGMKIDSKYFRSQGSAIVFTIKL